MELKKGLFRTRCGRKAEILMERSPDGDYVLGIVHGEKDPKAWFQTQWNLGGKIYPNNECPNDIVGVWREPIEIERWANVYPDGNTVIWTTKEAADRNATINRVACIRLYGKEESYST